MNYLTAEGVSLCSGDLQRVLSSFNGGINSLIWCDSEIQSDNPGLTITRPTMNRPKRFGGRGPGGALLHQHGVSFITSPDIACFLKTGTDQTLVRWQSEHGLIGEVFFIDSISAMLETLKRTGRDLYATDDYGPAFEQFGRNTRRSFLEVNRKSCLKDWAALSYLPYQEEFDAAAGMLSREMFDRVSGDGIYDIFLKQDNGEYNGLGVVRVRRGEKFFERACAAVAKIVETLEAANTDIRRFGSRYPELSMLLTVQQEVAGLFRSFHVFLDPREPNSVQLLGITDKYTDPSTGHGLGNLNYPLTAESVQHVAPAILEIVAGIRRRHPDVFGFFYCDFVEPEFDHRRVVLIDPGLRPSGNTAACMTALRVRSRGGGMPYLNSDFRFDTQHPGTTWAQVVSKLGELCCPESVLSKGRGILPIGWNPIQGTFRGISVAPSTDELAQIEDEAVNKTGSVLY